MKLTQSLAEKIVRKTMELTQLNINVMNKDGIIISSSNAKRIDTFHEGAHSVIQSGEEIMISSDNCNQWQGTKPGINMPIYFQQEIVGVIGISGEPEEVIPFGKAVKMMTEMMLQEAFLTEQIETEERSKNYLVQDIISGTLHKSLDVVLARGELLGIDLALPRSIMIIQFIGSEQDLKKLEQNRHRISTVSSLFRNPKQVLVSIVKRDRWIVITDLSACKSNQQMKRYLYEIANKMIVMSNTWGKVDVRISMGNCYRSVFELEKSFQEALKVLQIIGKFSNKGKVKHIDDVSLELILTEVSEYSRKLIIQEALGPLVQYPELLDTLQALFDSNFNLTSASTALNIHRNTLLYRLEKIEELIGANPRDFQQAVRMQMALLLRKSQM